MVVAAARLLFPNQENQNRSIHYRKQRTYPLVIRSHERTDLMAGGGGVFSMWNVKTVTVDASLRLLWGGDAP